LVLLLFSWQQLDVTWLDFCVTQQLLGRPYLSDKIISSFPVAGGFRCTVPSALEGASDPETFPLALALGMFAVCAKG